MSLRNLLPLLFVLPLAAGSARGDDKAPTPADLDKQARTVARDVVTLGAALFNGGNQEGCYRLYEGALMALRPMVAHRADVARAIVGSMARAKTLRTTQEQAFALREALDAVMAEPGAMMKKASAPGKKPLWDRLGGEKGVRAVVREFLVTASKDPKANIDRNGNYPLTKERVERVEQQVVEFISSVTGGPLKYTGRDMLNAHKGMRITEAEFDAAAGHLVAALKKFDVPQAEIDELVGLVGSVKNDIVESGK